MRWTTVLAVVGVAVAIFGFSKGRVDNILVPFYGAFVALWSGLLPLFWRRYNARLAFQWGMRGFVEPETTRSRFKGELAPGFYAGGNFVELDASKYPPEERALLPQDLRELPATQRLRWLAASAGTLVAVGFSALTTMLLLRARVAIADRLEPARGWGAVRWGPLLGDFCVAAGICAWGLVFRRLALFLSNLENHRTKAGYERSVILRVFFFDCFNNYLAPIYVGVIKPHATLFGLDDGCRPDCLTELSTLQAAILVTTELASAVVNILLPLLVTGFNKLAFLSRIRAESRLGGRARIRAMQRRKSRAGAGAEAGARAEAGPPLDAAAAQADLARMSTNLIWREFALSKFPGFSMAYTAKIVQFGHLCFFSAAFPLGPLIILLGSVAHLHSEAHAMIRVHRRPAYRGAENLGAFDRLLEGVGLGAAIFNAVIACSVSLAVGSDILPDGVTEAQRVWAVIFFEHIILAIRLLIRITVAEVPSWIEESSKRQIFEQTRLSIVSSGEVLAKKSSLLDKDLEWLSEASSLS